MITVLVVVIVLLLVLLGIGATVTVRNRGLNAGGSPRLFRERHRSPDAPPTSDRGDTAVLSPEALAPPPAQGDLAPPVTAAQVAPPLEEELEGLASEEVAIALPDAIAEAKAPRLRQRIERARSSFGGPLAAIRRRQRLDEVTFEELETALLLADVGLSTTTRLLDPLRERVRTGALEGDASALVEALRVDVVALFHGEDRSLHLAPDATTVWLFVGVNGVGKTTTIGKLASFQRAAGRSVVLAAGDTFRAAAGEQLEQWAERADAAIVRGADGADPSSVVFDAVQHAHARGVPLVLADTAGRLHTKVNLMEELRKVRRIADRPPGEVHEVLLVLDATTGQNGLVQARQFAEAVGVTGVVLTKLDGTAKGGIVLAIRDELGLPIKLVGLGEGVEDLVEFDPEEFVNTLFE